MIAALFLLSGAAGMLLYLYQHPTSVTIPLMETYHFPALFVKQIEGDPDAGRKIFNEFCGSCHSATPPIEVNAPLINNKKQWQILEKLGMPWLLERTIKGTGAMPARGGCFECSDAQLQEAIQYMIDENKSCHEGLCSQKKK